MSSDARVMAATNRDLEGAVERGRFREDLFYRLNVFPVRIPPLRDRSDDVPLLAHYFANTLGERMGKPEADLSAPAQERLRRYPWPGNVRELRNVVERALILCDGSAIEPRHLPAEVRDAGASPLAALDETPRSLNEVVEAHILRTVDVCGGNHSHAARVLGISRSTLLARLKKLQES